MSWQAPIPAPRPEVARFADAVLALGGLRLAVLVVLSEAGEPLGAVRMGKRIGIEPVALRGELHRMWSLKLLTVPAWGREDGRIAEKYVLTDRGQALLAKHLP